jgi:hypothetical protein
MPFVAKSAIPCDPPPAAEHPILDKAATSRWSLLTPHPGYLLSEGLTSALARHGRWMSSGSGSVPKIETLASSLPPQSRRGSAAWPPSARPHSSTCARIRALLRAGHQCSHALLRNWRKLCQLPACWYSSMLTIWTIHTQLLVLLLGLGLRPVGGTAWGQWASQTTCPRSTERQQFQPAELRWKEPDGATQVLGYARSDCGQATAQLGLVGRVALTVLLVAVAAWRWSPRSTGLGTCELRGA